MGIAEARRNVDDIRQIGGDSWQWQSCAAADNRKYCNKADQ